MRFSMILEEEASSKGFEPIIVDLEEFKPEMFSTQ